ncbi:MAG: hypothetical protein HYY24_23055 [Verrucomicrobia bacterium]|nr:hypothetical protein [Verrucomicrobiota bacterium]
MQRRISFLAFLCAAGLLASPAFAKDKKPSLKKGVESKSHFGWSDCLAMQGGGARVIVAPAVGGRIVHYGLNGQNILYELPGSEGKTLANTPEGLSVGGYQCDVGPELRGLPDHKGLWLGPYRGETPRNHTIRLTSEPDRNFGVQLEKEIIFDPQTGELGLTQTMKNITNKSIAFCLWDRTLCQGGGFAFFPLKKNSRFKAGWSIRKTVSGKFVYDGTKPVSPKVKILDGVLVAEATGESTKIGADSDAGWIAYARGKVLFVKYYPYFERGNYSDGGNSVELYWDERVAELEPLSPEDRLLPGNSYSFPEKWTLLPLTEEVTTHEQARALVGRIPSFEF